MIYKNICIGGKYAFRKVGYTLTNILSFGIGPLYGCHKFTFTPDDKSLPSITAIQWKDGHIDKFKYI